MKLSTRIFFSRPKAFIGCAMAGLLCLSGCVADDEVDKTTAQFVQSATTLSQAYEAFLNNANTVEADNYIDGQTFEVAAITSAGISDSALITTSEIELRVAAIKALTDYTTALSSLAADKPSAQIQADAATANSSLKTLTADATNVFDKPAKGAEATDFATPVSDAGTAISAVLKLIEDHRAASAIRTSLEQNDPKVTPLYSALEEESKNLFARVVTTTSGHGVILFSTYEKLRTTSPVDQGALMQVSDRIKQYETNSAALSTSDPTKAIKGFESSHAALVKLITAKEDKKTSLASAIAEVKSFAAEVKAPPKTSTSTSNTKSN